MNAKESSDDNRTEPSAVSCARSREDGGVMAAYYNEFKPEAAHMLRQLINDGLIAPGDVDERSITEVKSDDIKGYTQCHFFAGIGGWSVALRLAGWDDSRPVWTGSCPCQPFSNAGKRKGKADERHLWPVWFRLIKAEQPVTLFGEQVASAINMGISDEEMFCMLNGETPIGVQEIWRQVKGWSTASMQAMSARVREEVAFSISGLSKKSTRQTQGQSQDLRGGIHRGQQSSIFDFLGEKALPEKGHPVRPGFAQERIIGPYFLDAMRNYWISAEGKARETGLQQSFHRQNRPIEGLSIQQCKDSLFRHKRGDGAVGAGEAGNHHQALEGILNDLGRIAAEAGTKFTGKTSHGWWDDVADDLEAEGYAVGAAILPACSVGKPHKRDRLWFVGNSEYDGHAAGQVAGGDGSSIHSWSQEQKITSESKGAGQPCNVADTSIQWLACPDGKQRPVEPGICLLAHGVQHRAPILHAFGNAIVPQVAAEFIKTTNQQE